MTKNPMNVLRRSKEWKSYVEQALLRLSAELDKTREDLARETASNRALTKDNALLHGALNRISRDLSQDGNLRKLQARSFHRKVIAPLATQFPELAALGGEYTVLAGRRSSQLLILFIRPDDAQQHELQGDTQAELRQGLANGELRELALILPRSGHGHVTCRGEALLEAIEAMPLEAMAWLEQRHPAVKAAAPPAAPDYSARLSAIVEDIERLDFRARASRGSEAIESPPFDQPEALPKLSFAEPRRKSALLLHNNYYHFNCLGAGLRRRGWDTLTVSLQAPDGPDRQFLHGEDLSLFDPNPAAMARKTRDFFNTVPERFGALHFHGQGYATFFGQYVENSGDPQIVPWDFLELRRHRLIIGYMPSGCLDGGLKSSIRELTGGLCARCVWDERPDICNDAKNGAWNTKLALLCDWVGLECDLATPERIGSKTVYGPVVAAIDPERWRPNLDIPDDMRIARAPGEILIYHAVGNYAARRQGDRDIKGTGAVLAAIEQLKAEGLPVQLVFAHDIPSTRVRFVQVQADIVVDQLNYGRYGANAREAMMLGKPTICRLRATQASPLPPLRPILEAPMIDADEATIIDKLRALVLNADERRRLGDEARRFAVAWHGEDACAERYERVIDRVRNGLPADSPDLYPAG